MRLLFFSKMTWPKKAIRNMLLVLYDMMSEKVISIWVNKTCKVTPRQTSFKTGSRDKRDGFSFYCQLSLLM